MAKNVQKPLFSYNFSHNMDNFSQFQVAPEEVQQLTQPSIILKGGLEEIDIKRLTPKEIEQWLLAHPTIPRGIEIKANRMTSRGFRIEPADESPEAQEAVTKMEELLKDSGDELLINSWIQDAYAFGDGYLTLLPDEHSNEVVFLTQEHPVFFRIAREKNKKVDKTNQRYNTDFTQSNLDWPMEYGAMKIDPITKKPRAYTQVVYNESNKNEIEPIGLELRDNQVAHLVFDTWGDEAQGISLVQYVSLLLKYLMNIEEAGAEAIYRAGFTQKKITTNIRNKADLEDLARKLKKIHAAETITLPDGTDAENLFPGTSQFVEFHDKFLNLIAMRLGIPKPILTLDGTDINKACYSEDTQVLTSRGWLNYWEVTPKDKIAQYNVKTGLVEFINHDGQTYVYDYKGDMISFNSHRVNMLVTPDHRMFVRENNKDGWELKQANALIKKVNYHLRLGGAWVGKEKKKYVIQPLGRYKKLIIDMDDWLEFIGYMISEGGLYKLGKGKSHIFTIAQKQGNHENMIDFLHYFNEKYGINASYYFDEKGKAHRFSYCNKQLWTEISKFGLGAKNKKIGRELLEVSARQLIILYNALMAGDGSKEGNSYSTISNELANDFIELCLKIGKVASYSIHKDKRLIKRGGTRHPLYRLSISSDIETTINQKNISLIPYNGRVWCFSVPSGVFITRRNGKIAIQGNTMQELTKDMINDIHADELKVRRTIEDRIFVPACKSIFGDGFEKFPKFFFNDFVEGKDEKATVLEITSKYISNMTDSYLKLKNEDPEVAAKMLKFMLDTFPDFVFKDSAVDGEKTDELVKHGLKRNEGSQRANKKEVPEDIGAGKGSPPTKQGGDSSET